MHLTIHDFGAGQIRLSELSEMAPEIVKFDCGLIQGINKATSKRQRLVAAMTKMVKELGITAMAEYIESPGEHETLKQLGIQYAQGFHYGRPVEVSEFSANSDSQSPIKNLSSNHNLLKELKRVDDAEKEEQSREIRNAEWLLKQRKESFTIQLTMSSLESRAMKFVAKQSRGGDYAVYRKKGSISEWFVVVYGVYKDRATAKAAAATLKSVGVSPWLRSIQSVHDEINAVSVEK